MAEEMLYHMVSKDDPTDECWVEEDNQRYYPETDYIRTSVPISEVPVYTLVQIRENQLESDNYHSISSAPDNLWSCLLEALPLADAETAMRAILDNWGSIFPS